MVLAGPPAAVPGPIYHTQIEKGGGIAGLIGSIGGALDTPYAAGHRPVEIPEASR